MTERIVYGQKDLEKALADGLRSVTLCAGIYSIPIAAGVAFERLGPVIVKAECTRRAADEAGMVFCGFYPDFRSEFAADSIVSRQTVSLSGSGSYGSGSQSGTAYGSGSGFWGSGSFAGSYALYGSGIYVLGYGIDLI